MKVADAPSATFHLRRTMQVHSLSISQFRNIPELSMEFAPGANVFYGANGSGKTNLLEAIFTLCLGRSQRGANDVVMVRQGEEVYRLEGSISADGRDRDVAVAYQRGGRKKITIDGVVSKIAELYDYFCAVSAGPEDSEILSGPPSTRRTFVDMYLSQFSQKYLRDLTDYQKAIAQKNAALKQQMDPAPFDPIVIKYGAQVMLARQQFLRDLAEEAVKHYERISGGESLQIEYKPSVSLDEDHASLDEIETAFEMKLESAFDRERIMQTSMVGPHRDDVHFDIAGFPARTHGSQGQLRTAAISLKLAIYSLLKEKRDMPPLLLLDEIFAELDDARSAALIEAFGGFSQLFLTTAVQPPEALREIGKSYRIKQGEIVEQD